MNEPQQLTPDPGTDPREPAGAKPHRMIPVGIAVGVTLVLVLGGALVWRAEAKTNKVALAASPKPVTVIKAAGTTYRANRVYVGTLRPWIEASVGPQFISAYVETVLVRPGAVVTKGQVLATLDCRNATAATHAIAAQAQAIDAKQQAAAHESARTQSLLDGGFVSANEAELKSAQSTAEAAELAGEQASLAKSSLDVNDCVLRAPFDGEVATRTIDPGAFVRPGVPIVSVVDRSTIRMTADAPEDDFDVVSPSKKVTVRILATKAEMAATITRRAPSADPGTRTIHFEIDLYDPQRQIPVDTTGEVHVSVGEPVPATRVPISAVSTNGKKGTLFVVDGDVAHQKSLETMGELGGDLYFKPADLPADTEVVTEGRALLATNDKVAAHVVAEAPASGSDAIVTDSAKASTAHAAEKAP